MSVVRIFFPICINRVYCVNCTKFGQFILRIIIKTDGTMSDFKAKMHQNRFRLGLPQTPMGEPAYDAPPNPLVSWEGIGA